MMKQYLNLTLAFTLTISTADALITTKNAGTCKKLEVYVNSNFQDAATKLQKARTTVVKVDGTTFTPRGWQEAQFEFTQKNYPQHNVRGAAIATSLENEKCALSLIVDNEPAVGFDTPYMLEYSVE